MQVVGRSVGRRRSSIAIVIIAVVIIVIFLSIISIIVVIIVSWAPQPAFLFLDSGAGMAFARAAGWQRR